MIQKSLNILTLLGVASALTSLIAHAKEPKTLEQYWQETGLTLSAAADLVTGDIDGAVFEMAHRNYFTAFLEKRRHTFALFPRQGCYDSKQVFIACVQGLNREASYLNPPAVFATPQEKDQKSPALGKLIRSYGALNLYEAVRPSNELARWARKLQLSALTDLQRESQADPIHFADLMKSLDKEIMKAHSADEESWIASDTVNTYLGSAIDPHTQLMPEGQFQDMLDDKPIEFGGIGTSLVQKGRQVLVLAPLKDSPALAAGIKAGDVLVSVDGKAILNMEEAATRLRGAVGSKVTLHILRKGMPLWITITRKEIVFKKVDYSLLQDAGVPIGYIQLIDFMESDDCDKITEAILKLQSEGARGLILDLRSNRGGLVNQAVCIGSLFMGTKVIVEEKELDGSGQAQLFQGPNPAITDLPMVTLINGASASASEILAGALQDYQRSWIAGLRSFGKATVQETRSLAQDVLLAKTTARFYQPSGRTNQIVGILPDFPVDPFPNATAQEKSFQREEDLYINALPPLGKKWVESRPAQVEEIKKCVNTSGRPLAEFIGSENAAIPPDFQVLTAEMILNCAGL